MKPIELETLAVMFRANDPNLGHVSTLEAMTEAGLAYMYGHYRGIPQFHRQKRRKLRETIARELDRKAQQLVASAYDVLIREAQAKKRGSDKDRDGAMGMCSELGID